MEERDMNWKVLESEYVVRRPWLTARRDKVMLPDGRINNEYYVLEYPDWVNVIAITKEGLFVIERQYRHGLGRVSYEICAGVMEEGETPLEAAQRELKEETGFAGGEWREFMTLSQNASNCSNITHCFIATGVEKVAGQCLDDTEDIEYSLITESEVRRRLENDEFRQALMIGPLWRYFAEKK